MIENKFFKKEPEKAVPVGLITPYQNKEKVKEYLDELAFPGEGKDFKIYGYGTGKIWKNMTEISNDTLKNL